VSLSPGIWSSTAGVRAAVSLPDPAIAVRAARDAEIARMRLLINMYKDVVQLDECMELEDEEIELLETQRERVREAAEREAVREAKKQQPQRHRPQEEEEHPEETLVLGAGQILVQRPEEEDEVEEMEEAEYEDWEDRITTKAPPGGWWAADN
jgi:hypothetical protein